MIFVILRLNLFLNFSETLRGFGAMEEGFQGGVSIHSDFFKLAVHAWILI